MTDAPSFSLGLVGAGSIANLHADAAHAVGITVAGAFDVDVKRARRLTSRFDGAEAVSKLDDLLGRDDVDAVVVAVPNHMHKDLALAALEAGKHVLLEKPMAMSLDECDEIIAAAERVKRALQMNFVTRRAPAVEVVRRLVDAGRFGTIYHARGQWFRRRGIPGLGGWFTTKEKSGGGVLIDIGVHMIDLILHLTGRPAARRVSGACTSTFGRPITRYTYNEMWAGPVRGKGTFDVEDGAAAFIRFDDGLTAQIGLSWAANVSEQEMPCSLLLLGDKAGCHFDPWSRSVSIASEDSGTIVDIRPEVAAPGETWQIAWRRQHEMFREVAQGRRDAVAPPAHGREVQAILDAVYRSDAEGCEVAV